MMSDLVIDFDDHLKHGRVYLVEIEVEYQDAQTIGKFGIEFQNGIFQLTPKQTTCLAQDHCGIPADKMEPKVGSWKPKETSCCTTDSGCC